MLTRTAVIRHRSILGNIFNQFPFTTERTERIEPYIRAPWWTLRVEIKVATDKKSAKKLHDRLISQSAGGTINIYTDGSGINERIGAASYNKSFNQVLHQHLGHQTHYNVYGAELTAINLGISQLRNHRDKSYIFTDSQTACASLQKPRRQSGQSIIAPILDQIDHNPTLQRKLTIVWIPGHMDIDGNERADMEAKHAAMTSTAGDTFKYSPLKSCRVQQIKAMAKKQWSKEWLENTKTAHHLRRIQTKQGTKIYNNMVNRASCAQLAQLRTGHCGLNKYLHRFGKRDSPTCGCGHGVETVEHFLLECRKYCGPRKELRKRVGWGRMKTRILLGDTKILKHTMAYIKATKRIEM